jgi:hypothetical protein
VKVYGRIEYVYSRHNGQKAYKNILYQQDMSVMLPCICMQLHCDNFFSCPTETVLSQLKLIAVQYKRIV